MKLLRLEPHGLRSVAFVTSDGIVTAVLAEHGGVEIPNDEVAAVRADVIEAMNDLLGVRRSAPARRTRVSEPEPRKDIA